MGRFAINLVVWIGVVQFSTIALAGGFGSGSYFGSGGFGAGGYGTGGFGTGSYSMSTGAYAPTYPGPSYSGFSYGSAYGSNPAYAGSGFFSPLGSVNPGKVNAGSVNPSETLPGSTSYGTRHDYSYPTYNRGTNYASPPTYSNPPSYPPQINSSMHMRQWTMRRGR